MSVETKSSLPRLLSFSRLSDPGGPDGQSTEGQAMVSVEIGISLLKPGPSREDGRSGVEENVRQMTTLWVGPWSGDYEGKGGLGLFWTQVVGDREHTVLGCHCLRTAKKQFVSEVIFPHLLP